MHQLAQYSADPQKEHGLAVEYLCMYLNYTSKLGIKFKVDEKKGFECYADADFAEGFNRDFSQDDPASAKSCSGWYIIYAGCPISGHLSFKPKLLSVLQRLNTLLCRVLVVMSFHPCS